MANSREIYPRLLLLLGTTTRSVLKLSHSNKRHGGGVVYSGRAWVRGIRTFALGVWHLIS